jgi:small subunit ribosomal protein S16
MLAIRLQRTGRSGHSQFRVIVQDSRFSPTRGRVVAYLGSYDPHTKTAELDGPKASQYLEKGAQPSDRVARLLKTEGIKLPAWVKLDQPQKRATRNPDKRRSTRPAQPEAPASETAAEPAAETAPVDKVPAEPVIETEPADAETAEETPATEAAEAPAAPEPEIPTDDKPAEPAA